MDSSRDEVTPPLMRGTSPGISPTPLHLPSTSSTSRRNSSTRIYQPPPSSSSSSQPPHSQNLKSTTTFTRVGGAGGGGRTARTTCGINLNKLKGWSKKEIQSQLMNEEARQELALMKMKSIVISNSMIVRLQSWWRMMRCRVTYFKYRRERFSFLFAYFRGWMTAVKAEISYRVRMTFALSLSLSVPPPPLSHQVSLSLSLCLTVDCVEEALQGVVE
jgi:hypothetical protein